jgi:flagellar hook-length control protein FliK
MSFETIAPETQAPPKQAEAPVAGKGEQPVPENSEPVAPRADLKLPGLVQQLIGERNGPVTIETDQPADPSGATTSPVSNSSVLPANGLTAILQPGTRPALIDVAPSAAPIDAANLAIERQLDLSSATEWLDGLARDIASAANLREKLSFSLSPAHLGRLDVEMTSSEAGVSVGFRAENADARAIIAQAQPRLAEEMRNNGLRLADTQIFSGSGQERDSRGNPPQHDAASPIIETASFLNSETNEEDATAPTGRFA